MLGVPLQPIYEWIRRGLILNNIIIIGGVRHLAVIYTLYNKTYNNAKEEGMFELACTNYSLDNSICTMFRGWIQLIQQ